MGRSPSLRRASERIDQPGRQLRAPAREHLPMRLPTTGAVRLIWKRSITAGSAGLGGERRRHRDEQTGMKGCLRDAPRPFTGDFGPAGTCRSQLPYERDAAGIHRVDQPRTEPDAGRPAPAPSEPRKRPVSHRPMKPPNRIDSTGIFMAAPGFPCVQLRGGWVRC